ncbi:hypothetical protein PI125_g821 [Phytophthora idaei]|nr:hypothetical protein PI125_g821 [Phytophthora idaei]
MSLDFVYASFPTTISISYSTPSNVCLTGSATDAGADVFNLSVAYTSG